MADREPNEGRLIPARGVTLVLVLAVVAVLGVLAAVDEVRWSLHLYYRRQPAGVLAVRRLCHANQVNAEPYDVESCPGPGLITQTPFSVLAYGCNTPNFLATEPLISGSMRPSSTHTIHWAATWEP